LRLIMLETRLLIIIYHDLLIDLWFLVFIFYSFKVLSIARVVQSLIKND
jgi:hypothetical protein